MENEELIREIQNGINPRENMETLYTQNRGFIYENARKYSAFAELEDLMQEGFLALHDAAGRYDPERGSSFLTFFSYVLKSHFQRYIDTTGRTKRIPAYIEIWIRKYKAYLSESATAGKKPSNLEICQALNINKVQLDQIRKTMFEDCISLSDVIPGTDLSIGEATADPFDMEADVIERVAAEQIADQLWKIVDKLSDKECQVITNRYRYSKKLKEIGEGMGLSIDQIRQIEKRALKILSRKREIREMGETYGVYGSSKAFRGSVGSFKNHQSSVVEYLAVKEIEADERIRQIWQEVVGSKEDFQTIVP